MQLSRLNLCHSETSFVKFPFSIWHKYQNERTSKSLDGKIKESHQRGLPLTTQQLQQTQKDERLSSALIAPDETVWLKAAQIGGHMCVSVSQAAATAAAAATSLFWICETSLFSRKKHMTDEAQLWEEKWGVWIQGFLERNKNNLIWNKFNNSLQVILDAYLLSRYIAFVTAEGLIRTLHFSLKQLNVSLNRWVVWPYGRRYFSSMWWSSPTRYQYGGCQMPYNVTPGSRLEECNKSASGWPLCVECDLWSSRSAVSPRLPLNAVVSLSEPVQAFCQHGNRTSS